MTIRNDQVLDIFRELPGHRGCSEGELDVAESQLGVELPMRYREMMQLDAGRLCGAGIVAPIRRLQELRQDAIALLIEDGHSYRPDADDVVFAWEDIYAFYFFKADGNNDPPVMMFNYDDSEHDWAPVIAYDTLTTYFTDALRRYLDLN
ncbi:SMI1/KNR4 family protein [Stieleria varia]|nr:SMI1/KNR4 family protein [Stieleria varia]